VLHAKMKVFQAESFIWGSLLILVFFRPFINEYIHLAVGLWYVSTLIFFSSIYLLIIRKRILLPLRLNIWPALFIISILFSMFNAGYTVLSLAELYLFIPNVLIYYIASKIKFIRRKQLLISMFAAAFIICAYATYQYYFGFTHTLSYLNRTEHLGYLEKILMDKRVFATFISPNIFVSYVLMMLFISIGLLNRAWGKEKIIFWIAIIVMALSLFYTKSLGGILALAISTLIFIHYSFIHYHSRGPLRIPGGSRKIFCFFVVLILISATFLLRDRLLQLINLHNPNNSFVQRLLYWKASMNMAKDFPLTGIGWAEFGGLYEFYKPASANISNYSHNVFLQILVETGPLGLVSFLLIVAVFFKNGSVVIKNNVELRPLTIGLFCAGCAFLIHNIVDLSFYFGQASFFWWIILGLFSNFRAGDS